VVAGLDWDSITWKEGSGSRLAAGVYAVGHPQDGVFVLDQPPSQTGTTSVSLPCYDTVEGAPGSDLPAQDIVDITHSAAARAAGVYPAPGLIFVRQGGVDVKMDLAFPSEAAVDWLVANLTGMTLSICPIMTPVES
jgi:hypothetical protein